MAIADLYKREVFARLLVLRRAQKARSRDSSRETPRQASAGPLHAFQEAAPVNFLVLCIRHFFDHLSFEWTHPRPHIFQETSPGIKETRVVSFIERQPGLRKTGGEFRFGKDAVDTKVRTFELTMWPHVRAAYNFARWLVRNNHDAVDIVQEAFLRAYQAIHTFRGGDARSWMLAIVRNTAANFLRRRKPEMTVTWNIQEPEPQARAADPERALI